MRFMDAYLKSQSDAVRDEDFTVPAGVTLVPVDKNTGLRATPLCDDSVILEAVPSGREPSECNAVAHALIALPWPQQLGHYTYKPGEPPTTPEAIATAQRKLAEVEESGRH